MRIKLHDGVHDFTCARIGLRHANGPATPGAISPLNRRVADVKWTGTFGKIFHPQCITEASLFKGCIPPEGAAFEGRAHRLRYGALEIEGDRLRRFANRAGWIFLFHTPALNISAS